MVLASNTGFYNTKVKTAGGLYIYPSKVQINDSGARTLIINNIHYEVGNGARDITDKNFNLAHEVCTKYSILKHATSENISIVTALPISLYTNREYREKYANKWLGSLKGVVDGKDKTAYVTRSICFAEGAAAFLPHRAKFKDKVVGLLDIGGNTINCMIYSYGELQKETITTLDLGMIKLERRIIDELNSRKGWNVQEYEVREIIEAQEERQIIDTCIIEHIHDIMQRLLEKKWNLDRLNIFATGGGAEQLGHYLRASLNKVDISDNGLYDNVEGLYIVGGELFGSR